MDLAQIAALTAQGSYFIVAKICANAYRGKEGKELEDILDDDQLIGAPLILYHYCKSQHLECVVSEGACDGQLELCVRYWGNGSRCGSGLRFGRPPIEFQLPLRSH